MVQLDSLWGGVVATVRWIVTAANTLAPVVVALFTFLTWKVYQQIKGVMRESFEAEMRPVVYVWPIKSKNPQLVKFGDGQKAWRWELEIENLGRGIAVDVRFQRTKMETGKRGEVTKLLGNDLPAGRERGG